MALHRAKRADLVDTPHVPFYKDEKVLGKTVTVSVSLRFLIFSIVLVVVVFGYALFVVLRDDSNLHSYLQKAHASRVSDQQRTDGEISSLACFIVASIPDNPAKPIIKQFRDFYHCPPFGKDPRLKEGAKPKPSAASVQPSASKSAGAIGGGASTNKSTSSTGSNGSVAVGPAPAPSASQPGGSPAQPSSSPTQPAPAPSSAALVHLPGVSLPPVVTVPSLVGVGGTCVLQIGNTCVAG